MSFLVSQTITMFILITGQICSNDLPNSIKKYSMDYTGEVNCKKDTLLIIEYGHDKTRLPYFGENTLFHPYVFDIDEDLNIYLLYHNLLYKFSSKTGVLIWGKQLSDDVLDFKYYNRKIFVYEKDKLIVLNCFNSILIYEISLKELNVNTLGVQNLSFFYDHYLFLQDFNFSNFKKK